MKIIVECGATKSDWRAISSDGSVLSAKTAGINLANMPMEAVSALVDEAVAGFGTEPVESVHFYAAGLISNGEAVPDLARGLHGKLCALFPAAEKEYASDLLAAARAVCGNRPGIAAILGTGSNSCFYDGENVFSNVRSGGFILGDEGGGAVLGKLFVSDFLKNRVPAPIAEDFAARFDVDYLTIVKNVYRGDAPARYLGQFAPFILEYYGKDDYVTTLVEDNFRNFIERALRQYDVDRYPVGVVGGFGYACREILRKVGAVNGVTFSRICATPIEGLIEYHRL